MSELEEIINELRGKKVAGIYRFTNPVGGMYVGSSVDLRRRLLRYKSLDAKGQIKVLRSFNKYGVLNHKFEILEIIEEPDKNRLNELLNEREVYWGTLYDVTSKNNLTLKLGKRCPVFSQETRDKISKSNKGKVKPPISDQQKLDISNTLKGRKIPKEVIEKRELTRKLNGKKLPPMSQEGRQRLREIMLDQPERIQKLINYGKLDRKEIIQCDKNGMKMKEWLGISTAAEATGIQRVTISACLNKPHKNKTAGGFIWKFKKDYEDPV